MAESGVVGQTFGRQRRNGHGVVTMGESFACQRGPDGRVGETAGVSGRDGKSADVQVIAMGMRQLK